MWTNIMKRFTYVSLPVVLVIISYLAGSWNSSRVSVESAGVKSLLYYHCPMHPGIKSDKPGAAPCCGMDLVPVYSGEQQAASETKPSPPQASIHISPEKQQVIGVRTGVAETSRAATTIRVLGKVAADETLIYKIRASADGWVQEIYPNTVGSLVKKGEPLVSLFAPDFLAAEQAYIIASGTANLRNNIQLKVTESQLQFFGMDAAQLEELRQSGQVKEIIQLHAPATGFVLVREVSPGLRFQKGDELYRIAELDRVWVLADIYENEARYLRPGMTATVSHPQLGKDFKARISDIQPQFDAATRTLKVRLEADNPGYVLRPDMFVDIQFPLNLPPSLTVPSDAVLDSGLQKTVFVDSGNGNFEPRRVETGWRLDNRVEILKGLTEGEKVVVSGNFLIDSESRLQGLATSARTIDEAVDPVCGMKVAAGVGSPGSVLGGKT